MSPLKKSVLVAISFAMFGFAADYVSAQSLPYPPYGAHRGRIVARNGFGHSIRYRWGNGLTPQGAAFLTSAVDALAPAVVALAGRESDSEARSRAFERSAVWQDYTKAQNEANALLARTASLLTNQPVAVQTGAEGATEPLPDPSLVDPTRYSPQNPWDAVEEK